ncbi:MAG TPA: rhomboid family intramembrane serine protease [Pyrinomonadaceae bacterium]|nr:rhomboid family intramembrane serine protease [Pyrinomonadaceae bacterium]
MSFQPEERDEESEELERLQQGQITPEEFLAERKSSIRKRSWWSIGIGLLVILAHFALFAVAGIGFNLVFRSILFVLGIFFVIAGVWFLYEARRLTLEDLIPSPEALDFIRQSPGVTPHFSYIILGCLIAVFFSEMAAGKAADSGDFRAVEIAGLLKPDVWTNGEYWRILTSGALHAGFLHIYFNSQALYGLGSSIEILSNRAHLSIVFLLAIIGGSLLSIIFMPEGRTVGASGGIMGLIGYLAIYGYRRKQQLPPDFLRTMLVNIGFVAAFGLIAYQIVDNFAHLGGLLVGSIYGFIQVPRSLRENPRQVSAVTEALGLIAMGVFVFVSILSILLILEYIKF